MGRRERRHRGFATEGAILLDAGRLREGDHTGQAGDEERVRMSGLQDQNARPDVRVDVQFQEPRQADQVDLGRCRDSPADLIRSSSTLLARDCILVTVPLFTAVNITPRSQTSLHLSSLVRAIIRPRSLAWKLVYSYILRNSCVGSKGRKERKELERGSQVHSSQYTPFLPRGVYRPERVSPIERIDEI